MELIKYPRIVRYRTGKMRDGHAGYCVICGHQLSNRIFDVEINVFRTDDIVLPAHDACWQPATDEQRLECAMKVIEKRYEFPFRQRKEGARMSENVMRETVQDDGEQPRIYIVYPFMDDEYSVRTTQMFDFSTSPASWADPLMEVSAIRLPGPARLKVFLLAIDKIYDKFVQWNKDTGKPVIRKESK